MASYATTFAVGLFSSFILTYCVRESARRRGLVAKPRADRWHKKPTALFGGVGIFLAFMLALVLNPPEKVSGSTLLVACSSAMFLLGLVDDVVNLKPQAKLVVQIAVAILFTTYGMRLYWLPAPVLDQALTVFWLVGITNALNLLDNIDGAAAGVAAISASFLAYFSYSSGNPSVALLAVPFCGAVLGFLVYNFNPASIFMGDSGSLFLGFFLGSLPMLNHQSGARRTILSILLVPVLLLLIPILDTSLVALTRAFHGRAVSQGGRDHTSHRLVALGLSERAAALTLWGLAALAGALALMFQTFSQAVGLLLVFVFAIGVLFFMVFLGRVRVYEPVTSLEEGRGRALLPTLHNVGYQRRIFEVLCDSSIAIIAYYGAYLLRFEGEIVAPHFHRMVVSLPLVVAVQLGTFLATGLYRGVWRYTSANDIPGILRSIAAGWLASLAALVIAYRLESISRAALVIDGILLLLLIPGSRIAFRWFRPLLARVGQNQAIQPLRALVLGAGDGGELLVREIQNSPRLGYHAVGFIDDDAQKLGREIHGVRVLGTLDDLPELLTSHSVERLLLSTLKVPEDARRRAYAICRDKGVQALELRIALSEPPP
jgi:UDP-GlcNAc:undecaprenyl-phosphate GlcNAc-1-phosphate transferase